MKVVLPLADGELVRQGRPLVMGILNVTPDSFSDGGRFDAVEAAVARAFALQEEGADIIDVGGESTRPGAEPVAPEAEARRVWPVLEALEAAGFDGVVSVDTRRAVVAAGALSRGARLVNDVSALGDPGMPEVVGRARCPVVLMHMQGDPRTMQAAPRYADVVREVVSWLAARRDAAVAAGVGRDRIVLDPGLGFGKRTGAGIEDNAALLSALPRLVALGQPVLVGASRKRFLGSLTGRAVDDRVEASVTAAAAAAWGGASILRVHDVSATVDALRVAAALDPATWTAWWGDPTA